MWVSTWACLRSIRWSLPGGTFALFHPVDHLFYNAMTSVPGVEGSEIAVLALPPARPEDLD